MKTKGKIQIAKRGKKQAPHKPAPQPAEPPEEHEHTCCRILAAEVPTASQCRSGVPGAGLFVHCRCSCGQRGVLALAARELEVWADTASWDD